MRFAFCLLVLLCACAPTRGTVLRQYDDWTGATLLTVNEREIHRDADGIGIVTARPAIILTPAGRDHAVLLNVRRRDANGPRVARVTSGAVTLDYRRNDRLFTHCLDGCQKAEIGAIHMSESAFRIAARTGLPLRIEGRRDRYEGVVPAEAFARVLRAGAGGT